MVVTIAGEVYDAIIDSLPSVAGALQFIFNKLEVVWDDLVSWLGFLFEWDDILRTHKVMKNVIRLYAQQAVDQISTLETKVESAFSQLQNAVNGWANLSSSGPAIGDQTLSSSQLPGYNTPQANWALHQTKSNSAASSTSYNPATPSSSAIDQILDQLQQMATQEESNVVTMVNQIKTEIIDNIYTLTPNEVMQKLGGIIATLLIDSAETVVTTLLQLLQIIISGLVDMLDAPLDIPVLSSLYKSISGDTLTFLDLICLVGAIPATIIFKLSTGNVPYPDNSMTTALINATDFSTLSSLIVGGQVQQVSAVKLTDSASAVKNRSLAAISSSKVQSIVAATLNIGALFGSGALAYFSALKWVSQTLGVNGVYSKACFASYLVYVAPSITSFWASDQTDWWIVMNNIITGVAIGKAFLDVVLASNESWGSFSPIGELIINAAWLAPDVQSYLESKNGPSDIATYIGAVFFDFGGILAPGTVAAWVGVDVAAVIFLSTEVLTLGFGLSSLAAGIAMAKETQ